MDMMLDCNVAKKCNSCQLNNLSYERQLAFKLSKCIKHMGRFCKIDDVIGMDAPFCYRNKAQAVFRRQRNKAVSWGLYKSTTCTPVITDCCKLHTDRANDVFNTLCKLIPSFKISVYDPYTGTGWLKSAVIREGFATGELMLILNGCDGIFPAKKTFVSAITKKHPFITTIVTTVNPDPKKLFIGKTQEVLYSSGTITDVLCGKKFLISPQSFYQINPTQTAVLYNTAINLSQLSGTQTVLDCYCGIGTIGICASDKAAHVYSVESNPDAIADARKNARLNNISNIEFTCRDATDYIKDFKKSNIHIDLAFVDPPRAGCSKEFLTSVCEMGIEKIVYISCNVETQARDTALLIKHGYTVTACQPVDMFPHTNHVENIAVLTKNV